MADKPPWDRVREFEELKRRCDALKAAVKDALAEQQSLHTRLVLTDLQKLDETAFFERVFGCPPPKGCREE